MGTVKTKLQSKLKIEKLEENLNLAKEKYTKYKAHLKRKNRDSEELETKISVIGIGKIDEINPYTFSQNIIPKIEEFIKNNNNNKNTENLAPKIEEYSKMLKTFTDAIEVREMPKTNVSVLARLKNVLALGGR